MTDDDLPRALLAVISPADFDNPGLVRRRADDPPTRSVSSNGAARPGCWT